MTTSVLSKIVFELEQAAGLVEEAELQDFRDAILKASRIFVSGAGRSGFVARGFANRLLHTGRTVFYVGEPTTPPIESGDLFIVVSGSGRTSSLLASAQKASTVGASIATITIDPNSPIGVLAESVVTLPGTTRQAQDVNSTSDLTSIQPVGTLFEQLAWLTCDSIIILLRDHTGQTNEDLLARHANME